MSQITEIWTYFRFRNPHSIGPVIIQCFLLLAALLIILGLFYVFLLVLAMAIHHFFYDRDPNKVPSFVKKSIQFSSESEESDDGLTCPRRKRNSGISEVKTILHKVKKSQNHEFSSDNEEFDHFEDGNAPQRHYSPLNRTVKPTLSMAAKRTNNLDKFMGLDIDVKKI